MAFLTNVAIRKCMQLANLTSASVMPLLTRRPSSLQGYEDHEYDTWDGEDAYADDGSEAFKAAVAVKGTCQEVEKSYFRLTSKPDPSLVRPEPVLRKALNRLVSHPNLWTSKYHVIK